METSIFNSHNAEFCTANTSLFKISDTSESKIYFRIVPVQEEKKLKIELKARKLKFALVRGNGSKILKDWVARVEQGKIRGDEVFDSEDFWRPISSFPKMPEYKKETEGRWFLHNGSIAKEPGGCRGCGESGITRVAWCHVDCMTWRFCSVKCEDSYGKYLGGHNAK